MLQPKHRAAVLTAALILGSTAALGSKQSPERRGRGSGERSGQTAAAAGRDSGPSPLLPDELRHLRPAEAWFGDLDELVERRMIRALVVPNRTSYFLDGGTQRGIAYESLVEFEKTLNAQLGRDRLEVYVLIIPVLRHQIFDALVGGRGDLAAANLTVTTERAELVDFSLPSATGVEEIVVAAPDAPILSQLDDLAGKKVWVRPDSSYRASLDALNADFSTRGLEPVDIADADEYLETEDLLEMTNAGLIDYTIADDHLAEFWGRVFDGMRTYPELAVRTGGKIAWALRKNTPQLKEAVDRFMVGHRRGTLFGNVLLNRYLKSVQWVRDSTAAEEMFRFRNMAEIFQRYASRYDFDWLLLIAQGYQESRLDQSVRSPDGAIGVMQLLPSTAQGPAVGIPNIEELEANVHAGVKYMRWIVDNYFAEEELDKLQRTLFAFAAYNAGPSRIDRLRREAERQGYDPDAWFRNVEVVVAERVGQEPVRYVSNIYKYYIAYHLVLANEERRQVAGDEPARDRETASRRAAELYDGAGGVRRLPSPPRSGGAGRRTCGPAPGRCPAPPAAPLRCGVDWPPPPAASCW